MVVVGNVGPTIGPAVVGAGGGVVVVGVGGVVLSGVAARIGGSPRANIDPAPPGETGRACRRVGAALALGTRRRRRHTAAGRHTAARHARARVAEAARLALQHRSQFDDAGNLERVERLRLIGHARQVDDDVLALDAHVGLGDAEALELVAHQVAHDDELVLVGRLGGGVDDRQAALEVEAQDRGALEADGEERTAWRRRP